MKTVVIQIMAGSVYGHEVYDTPRRAYEAYTLMLKECCLERKPMSFETFNLLLTQGSREVWDSTFQKGMRPMWRWVLCPVLE